MTFEEAKRKYEKNGGHYFEWVPLFEQEFAWKYLEKQRTFIMSLVDEEKTFYLVYGFDEKYEHVFGYGDTYDNLDDAIARAKDPGERTF